MPLRRLGLTLAAVLLAGMVAIQVVPSGRNHANPPVIAEPAWDSPTTRAMTVTACFDCHSNQSVWPWYSNVAPVFWLLQRHVEVGRQKLNFSTWGQGKQETDDISESVRDGEMPPWDYVILHPEARFTGADREAFLAGLTASFGGGEGGDSGKDRKGGGGDN